MKTFLLISVMLIASLFTQGRTVPDVHIRGTDMLQVQALDVVTLQLVELDNGVLFSANLVLAQTAEPAPVYYVAVPGTQEGYTNVVNPPPSITVNQFEYNRYRDVWKFLIADVAIGSNHLNYNFTYSYQRLSYFVYSKRAYVANPTLTKRYPSTKARMC